MATDPPSLPPAARDLFALDPDGFIAARDALAKELRDDGDAETAVAVKALRRPTVAAWAANQAARSDPELVQELLDAGERLAGAQRAVLSGKGAADVLRHAGDQRRELIRRLTDAAAAALDDAGRPSAGVRDEIAGTFEAATLDPEAATRVRAGVLERSVSPPSGLGGIEGFTVLQGGGSAPRRKAPPERDSAKDRREAERVVRAADKADAAAADAQVRARSARDAADEAAGRAEELEATARAAERDARRLANEAKTARKRAERATRSLEGWG